MTDFTTLISNTLEEVHMIAGDEQTFVYEIYNESFAPLSLDGTTCSVIIFGYGNPSYLFANLAGSVILSGSSNNTFSVDFSGSGLKGAFQQQVKIIDIHGKTHKPAQGKIIIFESNNDEN